MRNYSLEEALRGDLKVFLEIAGDYGAKPTIVGGGAIQAYQHAYGYARQVRESDVDVLMSFRDGHQYRQFVLDLLNGGAGSLTPGTKIEELERGKIGGVVAGRPKGLKIGFKYGDDELDGLSQEYAGTVRVGRQEVRVAPLETLIAIKAAANKKGNSYAGPFQTKDDEDLFKAMVIVSRGYEMDYGLLEEALGHFGRDRGAIVERIGMMGREYQQAIHSLLRQGCPGFHRYLFGQE